MGARVISGEWAGIFVYAIRLEFITAKECIQASRTWFVNCNNCPSNSRPFRYSRIYIDDSLVCAFERVSMVGVVRRGDEP